MAVVREEPTKPPVTTTVVFLDSWFDRTAPTPH
jgi:hypothetical protein